MRSISAQEEKKTGSSVQPAVSLAQEVGSWGQILTIIMIISPRKNLPEKFLFLFTYQKLFPICKMFMHITASFFYFNIFYMFNNAKYSLWCYQYIREPDFILSPPPSFFFLINE